MSVPSIEVYSDYPYDGTYDQYGTTTMDYRYIRHEYWIDTEVGGADLSGTWNLYVTESGYAERYNGKKILVHDDNTLSGYMSCGIFDFVMTKSGNTVQGSAQGGTTVTGNIDTNNTGISGTWTDPGGDYGTFRFVKISNSTTFIESGSLVIQGQLCNQTIDVNTTAVCAYKDFDNDNGELDDLEISTPHDNGWIGIEIETPHLLSSYTTFDLQSDNFGLDFEGTIVENCYGNDEIRASSGTVTIDIYDGTRLKGSFAVILQDGSNLTGSFDVFF